MDEPIKNYQVTVVAGEDTLMQAMFPVGDGFVWKAQMALDGVTGIRIDPISPKEDA